MKIHWFVLAIAFCAPATSWGKRSAPKPVPPVTYEGVTYSAGGDGETEYVVAKDPTTDKELWRVQVYKVKIKQDTEFDIQTVFISELKISGKGLFVRDERGRCYRVDLVKKNVQGVRCTRR